MESFFLRIRDAIWNYPYALYNLLKKFARFKNFVIVLMVFAIMYFLYSSIFSYISIQKDLQNTLYLGIVDIDNSYNPLGSNNTSNVLNRLVFSTLFLLDNNNNPYPYLASSWKLNSTHTIMDFQLNDKITWEDGKKINADDVIYSFNLQKQLNPKGNLSKISVAKTGDSTFEVQLNQVDSNIWEDLYWPIFPNHTIYSKYLQEGTGPYILSSRSNGQYNLVPNAKYFAGKAKISNVVVSVYNSDSDVYNAYSQGFINAYLLTDPGSEITQDILNEHNPNFYSAPLITNYNALFFNTKRITDSNIRKGISYSINRESLRSLLSGYCQLIDGPINPDSWAYTNETSVPRYKYSKNDALNSFKQAGYILQNGMLRDKNMKPLSITISYNESNDNDIIVNSIVTYLDGIGIDTHIKRYSQQVWDSNILENRNFDIAYEQVQGSIDPDPYGLWSASGKSNLSSYSNPNVNRVLDLGRSLTDQNQRKDAYTLFQKDIMNDAPAAFLYSPYIIFEAKSNIKGLEFGSNPSFETDVLNRINEWYFI